MPVFTPGRRWQPSYMPFKHEPLGPRALASLESAIKGPAWGCRMCGNCLLQETAFICPLECPKGIRNGSCGGVQRLSIGMSMRPIPVSGIKYMNVPSKWGARKCFLKYYRNDEEPGVFVPEKIIKRMEVAELNGNAQEEGVQIALELIENIKGKQG